MSISRREFLISAGSVALGGIASAQTTQPLILGSGEYRYECIHDWLTPPSWSGIRLGDTQGVAQDAQGRIYVGHTVNGSSKSDDAIAVFDEKGRFLNSWGARFKGGSHGLDIRREGKEEFLYHCDTNARKVVKTRLDGSVVWELGTPDASDKYKSGAAYIPTNIAFSPNGDFFVADGYGSNWIHHYDKNANYRRTFGGAGKDAGQVQQPHGIWLDNRGSEPFLAVADRANNRIQYFSLDGKHVKFVTGGMRLPCHFSIQKGVMLVPDLQSVVTLLDEKNEVIAHLGDGHPSPLRGHPRRDFIPGKFIHPHDAMFLRNGDILVAEWVPIGRVTLLRRLR